MIDHHIHGRWGTRLLSTGLVLPFALAGFSTSYAAPWETSIDTAAIRPTLLGFEASGFRSTVLFSAAIFGIAALGRGAAGLFAMSRRRKSTNRPRRTPGRVSLPPNRSILERRRLSLLPRTRTLRGLGG